MRGKPDRPPVQARPAHAARDRHALAAAGHDDAHARGAVGGEADAQARSPRAWWRLEVSVDDSPPPDGDGPSTSSTTTMNGPAAFGSVETIGPPLGGV